MLTHAGAGYTSVHAGAAAALLQRNRASCDDNDMREASLCWRLQRVWALLPRTVQVSSCGKDAGVLVWACRLDSWAGRGLQLGVGAAVQLAEGWAVWVDWGITADRW